MLYQQRRFTLSCQISSEVKLLKRRRVCCCQVASVMSDSVRPHRRQPTRLPHPWDSPGKSTGVGCHFLLQCLKVKSLSRVRLFTTPWTAAYQAPPSMGFSRQEYWSGVPLPSPMVYLQITILSYPRSSKVRYIDRFKYQLLGNLF